MPGANRERWQRAYATAREELDGLDYVTEDEICSLADEIDAEWAGDEVDEVYEANRGSVAGVGGYWSYTEPLPAPRRLVTFETETGIKQFPNLVRRETGLMEFLCEHGVGHPAGQSIAFMERNYPYGSPWDVHGCDGCCRHGNFPTIQYIRNSHKLVVIPSEPVVP